MKMMRIAKLIAVSLITGLLWRAELEFRWGWASMDWIGPFHWAFPSAAVLFLGWMWRELRDASARARQIVLVMTAVMGLAAYYAGGTAMGWACNRWIVLLPRWQCVSYMVSPVVVYAVLGLVYFITVGRLTSPSTAGIAAGVACFALAFPIALILLWITDHRGGPDPIHAIKSGFVFPVIGFGLGLPITMNKRTANQGLVGIVASAPSPRP